MFVHRGRVVMVTISCSQSPFHLTQPTHQGRRLTRGQQSCNLSGVFRLPTDEENNTSFSRRAEKFLSARRSS